MRRFLIQDKGGGKANCKRKEEIRKRLGEKEQKE